MKLDCDVIRDLLPLYAEKLASPASSALVEQHLAACPACRAAAVLAVLCALGLVFWMGGAKTPVTAEQAKIWTYNKKENEANLCVLEVQGENVWLELEGSFNWGKPSVTVRAVRYTFPHIHAALEGLLGTSASDTSIAVSGTQLLTVQCADETRYYRDGQQVERFILKKEDGTQTYVYESEDVVTQEQGVFEKG